MKKILFALLLAPGIAQAQVMPPGCFVADYYRTDACWDPDDSVVQWGYFGSGAEYTNYYGYTIGVLVDSHDQYEQALGACTRNRDEWRDYGTNQAASLKKSQTLVAKLRRACGSKCRKIK